MEGIMRKRLINGLAAAGLLAIGTNAEAADIVQHQVSDSFDNVAQSLADAIVNRGYVIDYTAQIGPMLHRTAADVGASTNVYTDARSMQFCSATLSRRAMEADPQNIAFCPYVLFAYELAAKPGEVVVGFRKLDEQGSPESREAIAAINSVLDEIVGEAAGID
jgi:hypothetical protein